MSDYELISLRSVVGDCLNEAFESYSNVYVIDSDLSTSTTTDKFQKLHPDHFVETGIAEQNALGIATGIASEGGIPFYVNFAIFASGTVWTQLRQACYPNTNVKIIATHPGVDGGFDGATHHANEDIALTRVLPNLMVLVPSTVDELKDAIKVACEHEGPVYIRCARGNVPNLSEAEQLQPGKAMVEADDGDDYAIIFEGTAAEVAWKSYNEAKARGGKGKLINVASVKPADAEFVRKLASTVKRIVTVENHSIIAGLGGLVAETVCDMEQHAPILRVGYEDVFTESGPADAIKEKYGLTVDNVVSKLGL